MRVSGDIRIAQEGRVARSMKGRFEGGVRGEAMIAGRLRTSDDLPLLSTPAEHSLVRPLRFAEL